METGFINILAIGILMLTGLLAGSLSDRLGVPRVACYVIAGAMLSPSLLGSVLALPTEYLAKPLTNIALGIIAFIIGGSITTSQLQRMGKTIAGIAFSESLGAVLLVFAGIMLLMPEQTEIPKLHLALAFAAISATTAPAGTIALLHQYRAKGPLSTTLLGVVALDDALGIIIFSVVMALVAGGSLGSNVGTALLEISMSILLGVTTGYFLAKVVAQIRQSNLMLPLTLGAILVNLGLAGLMELSTLLSSMTLGFFSRYFLKSSGDKLFTPIETLEETVFLLFFTLAGIHFHPGVFFSNLDLIAIYIFARVIGKIVGSLIGATLTGAPKMVIRYMGFALIPQAGVAIGLALILSQLPGFESISLTIVNVILATTMIYELLGPLAAKYALVKSGEIGEQRKSKT